MTESAKTLVFLGAAALSVIVAIATRPSTGDYDVADQVGKMLAEEFSPDEAKRLTIVEFDEETTTATPFEVAQSDGLWTLPLQGRLPGRCRSPIG